MATLTAPHQPIRTRPTTGSVSALHPPAAGAGPGAAAMLHAARMLRSARQAIPAAAHRRAAAVAAAGHAIDAALAAERAEQDAARSELLTAIRRLRAQGLTDRAITRLCQLPAEQLERATID